MVIGSELHAWASLIRFFLFYETWVLKEFQKSFMSLSPSPPPHPQPFIKMNSSKKRRKREERKKEKKRKKKEEEKRKTQYTEFKKKEEEEEEMKAEKISHLSTMGCNGIT